MLECGQRLASEYDYCAVEEGGVVALHALVLYIQNRTRESRAHVRESEGKRDRVSERERERERERAVRTCEGE